MDLALVDYVRTKCVRGTNTERAKQVVEHMGETNEMERTWEPLT